MMAEVLHVFWSTVYASGVLLFLQFALPPLIRAISSMRKKTAESKAGAEGLDKQEQENLLEKKWIKDTVYLYQMPGTKNLPSVSPYCLKIETFLRLHKINYERRYLMVGRGANGKLPFVELNGEHFSDSEIILRRLVHHFKIQEYADPKDADVGHAITVLADRHIYNIFLHYKVSHNPENLLKGMLGGIVPDFIVTMLVKPIVAPFVRMKIHNRLADAIGSFTDEEYRELTRKDLETLQRMLGDKKFLFGDKMTTADCAVFGHLGAMLYLGQHSHPNFLLLSHQFAPLREYVHRVRDVLFGSKFCM